MKKVITTTPITTTSMMLASMKFIRGRSDRGHRTWEWTIGKFDLGRSIINTWLMMTMSMLTMTMTMTMIMMTIARCGVACPRIRRCTCTWFDFLGSGSKGTMSCRTVGDLCLFVHLSARTLAKTAKTIDSFTITTITGQAHATLHPALSIRPSVCWSVTLLLFFYQFYSFKSF